MPKSRPSTGPWDDEHPDRSVKGRLSRAFLKPPDPNAPHAEVLPPPTLEELEAAERYANDTERLIGVVMAPLCAVVALIVVSAYVSHWKTAHPGNTHVPSYMGEILVLFFALSIVILAVSWFRKRLWMGLAILMYGLSVFDLNWKWLPFALPFLAAGSWLSVRAYRAHQAVKIARGDTPRWANRGQDVTSSRPAPSKRYTPPKARPKPAVPNHDEG